MRADARAEVEARHADVDAARAHSRDQAKQLSEMFAMLQVSMNSCHCVVHHVLSAAGLLSSPGLLHHQVTLQRLQEPEGKRFQACQEKWRWGRTHDEQ